MMFLADWWYSSFGKEETEEAKAIRKVMDKVEESLDTFTVPQWIPCKDHLPLFDFTDVLLLYHDKRCGCEDDYYIIQAYMVRGQWRPAFRIEDSDMESMEPVAWMPLPEPYKEEQNNANHGGNDSNIRPY